MRPPTDTERAVGSDRTERRRKHPKLTYIECFVGSRQYPGYHACERKAAREAQYFARTQGCVGYLDGHVYAAGAGGTVPSRRVRVFLPYPPPTRGFRCMPILPPEVAEAVLYNGGHFYADWTPMEAATDDN